MTTKQEKLDQVVYVRISGPTKKDIGFAAAAAKMEVAAWCRMAIEKQLGMKPAKFCACGSHYGHTGKHWPYTEIRS